MSKRRAHKFLRRLTAQSSASALEIYLVRRGLHLYFGIICFEWATFCWVRCTWRRHIYQYCDISIPCIQRKLLIYVIVSVLDKEHSFLLQKGPSEERSS